MNFTDLITQSLSLLGTFNYQILIFLVVICFIGEVAGIFVPYLLETTWLLAGYQVSHGELSFANLMLLVLATQAGRQIGAYILYRIGGQGNNLFQKYLKRFKFKRDINDFPPTKLFKKIDILSPYSVALGRLLWLRIPLTLILGAKRKLKVLQIGVLISGLIYDGIYIIFGAITGTTTKLPPIKMLVYFLAGLTLLYIVNFAYRRLTAFVRNRKLKAAQAPVKSEFPQKSDIVSN